MKSPILADGILQRFEEKLDRPFDWFCLPVKTVKGTGRKINGNLRTDLGEQFIKALINISIFGSTKASRFLILYVTTNSPSENLITFVMKTYVPMYFNVRYYNSVQNNAYFTQSANVLLTMLFDDRKEVCERALKNVILS